jgi:hypothetical protein
MNPKLLSPFTIPPVLNTSSNIKTINTVSTTTHLQNTLNQEGNLNSKKKWATDAFFDSLLDMQDDVQSQAPSISSHTPYNKPSQNEESFIAPIGALKGQTTSLAERLGLSLPTRSKEISNLSYKQNSNSQQDKQNDKRIIEKSPITVKEEDCLIPATPLPCQKTENRQALHIETTNETSLKTKENQEQSTPFTNHKHALESTSPELISSTPFKKIKVEEAETFIKQVAKKQQQSFEKQQQVLETSLEHCTIDPSIRYCQVEFVSLIVKKPITLKNTKSNGNIPGNTKKFKKNYPAVFHKEKSKQPISLVVYEKEKIQLGSRQLNQSRFGRERQRWADFSSEPE